MRYQNRIYTMLIQTSRRLAIFYFWYKSIDKALSSKHIIWIVSNYATTATIEYDIRWLLLNDVTWTFESSSSDTIRYSAYQLLLLRLQLASDIDSAFRALRRRIWHIDILMVFLYITAPLELVKLTKHINGYNICNPLSESTSFIIPVIARHMTLVIFT